MFNALCLTQQYIADTENIGVDTLLIKMTLEAVKLPFFLLYLITFLEMHAVERQYTS
jgi:hypothetical protein